jgi:hypothetical protein
MWLEGKVTELGQQVQRLRSKYAILKDSGLDAAGLEPVLTDLRERETELRTLDIDRRALQKKLAAIERSEAEAKNAEKAYHRLTAKRVSIISPTGPGERPRLHAKRSSVMMGLSSSSIGAQPASSGLPGFDPALAAMQAPDLNLTSAIDQQLFLERQAAKRLRDEQFEGQFGKLAAYGSGGGGGGGDGGRSSRSVSRRNSAALSRRTSMIPSSPSSGPSSSGSMPPPSRRASSLTPRARISSFAVAQPQWSVQEEEDELDEEEEDASGSGESEGSSDDSTSSRRSSVISPSLRGVSSPRNARRASSGPGASGRPSIVRIASLTQQQKNQPPSSLSISESGESPHDLASGGSGSPSSDDEEVKQLALSKLAGGGKGEEEEEEHHVGPRERPAFLTNAAEASAADLSSSLQNYLRLQTETPAGGVTATEALIDPHLREKISKALQAYIQASSQAAVEALQRMEPTPPAPGVLVPSTPPVPSREEELLWGLLLGCLRNEEEEQLAIEWWADREKQLIAEQTARQRKSEEASGKGALHQQLAAMVRRYSPDMVSRHLDDHMASTAMHALAGSSGAHAARGRLLNALARKQEELRQLKAGHLLATLALKAAHEMKRLQQIEQHREIVARAHHHHKNNSSPRSGRRHIQPTPIPNVALSPVEPMCRRFVLAVVASALANAGILARQDRIISDLRWSIKKAKRVRELTKNGSINRPPEARPEWISSVSQPSQMPRLTSEDSLHWLVTEADSEPARMILEQHGKTPEERVQDRERTKEKSQSLWKKLKAASPHVAAEAAVQTAKQPPKKSLVSVVLSVANKMVVEYSEDEEEEGPKEEEKENSSTVIPAGTTDRPGRGFSDPLYTPQPFSARALEDQKRRLGEHVNIAPMSQVLSATSPRKVIKLVRPPSASLTPLPASLPPMEAETHDMRRAVEIWQGVRLRDEAGKAEKTLARRGSTVTLDDPLNHMSQRYSSTPLHPYSPYTAVYPIDSPSLDTSHMPVEEISLLGAPPPLFVGPGVVDEWSLFVSHLDQAAARSLKRSKKAEAEGLSTRAGLTLAREEVESSADKHSLLVRIEDKPSKDPTGKAKPPPRTPAEVFAAGAVRGAHAVATIPSKHLPRSAYHGCTPDQPHFDREPDMNKAMQERAKQLSKRARALAAVDGGRTLNLVLTSCSTFDAHFHPGTNSLDWLPIDPTNPSRRCHAGCRVEYEVDRSGATVSNPLGDAAAAPKNGQQVVHPEDVDLGSPRGAQQRRPLSAQSAQPHRIIVVNQGQTQGDSARRPQTARPVKTYASATNHTGLSSKQFTNTVTSSMIRTVQAPPTPQTPMQTVSLQSRISARHVDDREPLSGWESHDPPSDSAGFFQPHPPPRPASAIMHQPRQPIAAAQQQQRPGTARR